MVKRCCWGTCESNTKYPERLDGVVFVPFPKPPKNVEKCKLWIKLCGRPHSLLNISSITRDTYVCSKHFVDGKPTAEHPHPVDASSTHVVSPGSFSSESEDSEDEDWRLKKLSTSSPSKTKPSFSPSSSATINGLQRKRRFSAISPENFRESWKSESDKDQEPELPKYNPKRTPGVQVDCTRSYSPLELFQLYFDMDVVGKIVLNTNKYAVKKKEQGRKHQWQPIGIDDLFKFIGLVIYLGLSKAKSIRDHWCTKSLYSHRFPSRIMSRNRFQSISGFLHLSDPDEDLINDRKKGTPGHDRLHRIKPLLHDILLACQTYFHPYKNLSIDERMVSSRPKILVRKHMQEKPTKCSYRLFVLADSSNGYTWNFLVHEGKCRSVSGKGLVYDSVMNLLPLDLLGTGYHLYVDSFYTTPALFRDLHKASIGACGAVCQTLQDFPKNKANDFSRDSKRGDVRWFRDKELLFMKWKDSRELRMCSTIHKASSADIVKRNVKEKDGSWVAKHMPVPTLIKDYNKHMGGVGYSDALINTYNSLHKTMKWYKAFFYHFVDIACVNSFLLHQEIAKSKGQKPMTHKSFREELIEALVNYVDDSQESEDMMSGNERAPCMPEFITAGMDIHPSMKASAGRRYCANCKLENKHNKTPIICRVCDVPLCLVHGRNCFLDWHKKKRGSVSIKKYTRK
ncbi:piggyBac transposable element-derived protein 4-like [Pygocentrus nattereri]|uniref:THAP-type domain-containing protein n=1 Tax=Pygocentrus nattereri TaxID=42514 RepID=A0A3B4D213_PYGNA|nr:piggyBac transposable element-derived protein 4-like [Pygocentrus nattereri]